MSADLISGLLVQDRPSFPSETEFLTAKHTSSEASKPPRGVANEHGLMIIDLPPSHEIVVSAQCNAAYPQYARVINYADKSSVTFRGQGEGGKSMVYHSHSAPSSPSKPLQELKIAKSAEWRSIGIQFGFRKPDGTVQVPQVKDVRFEALGFGTKATIVSEDGSDGDFNDTVLTVLMNRVFG